MQRKFPFLNPDDILWVGCRPSKLFHLQTARGSVLTRPVAFAQREYWSPSRLPSPSARVTSTSRHVLCTYRNPDHRAKQTVPCLSLSSTLVGSLVVFGIRFTIFAVFFRPQDAFQTLSSSFISLSLSNMHYFATVFLLASLVLAALASPFRPIVRLHGIHL